MRRSAALSMRGLHKPPSVGIALCVTVALTALVTILGTATPSAFWVAPLRHPSSTSTLPLGALPHALPAHTARAAPGRGSTQPETSAHLRFSQAVPKPALAASTSPSPWGSWWMGVVLLLAPTFVLGLRRKRCGRGQEGQWVLAAASAEPRQGARRVFVARLPFSVTQRQLKEHFSVAGDVVNVWLATEEGTGEPKGYGIVEYSMAEEARHAIQIMRDHPLEGATLAVRMDLSKATRTRPPPPSQPDKASAADGRRVFVKNLPANVTWQELKDHANVAGDVAYVWVATDRHTGESKGCSPFCPYTLAMHPCTESCNILPPAPPCNPPPHPSGRETVTTLGG